MRHILLIILTSCISTVAYANCAGNGISLLSKSSTLNKNAVMVLEFYGSSQLLVTELNKKYPIYLQSRKGTVTLTVKETLKGEFQVTQVVFKPTSELIESEIYTLTIDNLPEHERKPERYNPQTQKIESLTFRISNSLDNEKPILKNSITKGKKTMASYGCGPARWVHFNVSGQDKSELFVRATVKSKQTGNTTTYILPLENGQVKVGHGMCSGAFHFTKGDNYQVTFSLVDQSGNTSDITKPISFSRPIKEANE